MDELQSKITGSLLGGAVGDALGYQIEFRKNIKEKEITRFKDEGIISDDTQMTLFTANALIWRETQIRLKRPNVPFVVDAIYLGYKDWLDTQLESRRQKESISWIKDIPELNSPRMPGMTCMTALISGESGTIEIPINDSKGCGTVMRVAPIGLYINDNHEAGNIAAEASALTHGHPLGIIPSYVLASMLSLMIYEKLDILQSLEKSMNSLQGTYNFFNEDDMNYFVELINKAKILSKGDLPDLEAIKLLGGGWVAEEALAIAIYSCLKYSDNFEDAIVCAVNHDGDSDSTGAVAGNIIGAYLGEEAIPSYYLDNLELKDVIAEIAYDLAISSPLSGDQDYIKDKYWLDKYGMSHMEDKRKN